MGARRNWCFTVQLADFTNEDGTGFTVPDEHADFKYCVYQPEIAPTTGAWHLQGYVEFKTNKRIKAIKELFQCPGMHLEARQGTAAEARDYCMKGDTRVPGTEPLEFGKFTGQGHRADLEGLVAMARAGKSAEEMVAAHPGSYLRYYKGVQHLRQLKVVDRPVRTVDLQVWLFIGKPGTGKTRAAYAGADNEKMGIWTIPVKAAKSMWFDNYYGEPIVLLDDFSGAMMLDQLLRLLDRYPVQVEVKGGHVWWCPHIIIVTTNVHPKDWYDYSKRTDSRLALKRRFTQVCDFDQGGPDDNTPGGYMPKKMTMEEFWPEVNAFDVLMAPRDDLMEVDRGYGF